MVKYCRAYTGDSSTKFYRFTKLKRMCPESAHRFSLYIYSTVGETGVSLSEGTLTI